MRALVTGAAGFLGRPLISRLAQRGHHVRALSRNVPANFRDTGLDRVEWLERDLLDDLPGSILDGVDSVIHLACDRYSANATAAATQNLFESMGSFGRPFRVILVSSISVYDRARATDRLTESSPLESRPENRDEYARAKIAQEELARRYASEFGWTLTIARPGFIWGPRREWIQGVGIATRGLGIVIAADATPPVTHVENCSEALLSLLESSSVGAFNIVDDHGVSASRMAEDHRAAKGFPRFVVSLSYQAAVRVAGCLTAIARHISQESRLPGLFHLPRLEARFNPQQFDATAIRETANWKPSLSYGECLEHTYSLRNSNGLCS